MRRAHTKSCIKVRKGVAGLIKGINRQMIEILDTGNQYFERAFLVIQTGMDADTDILRREAYDVLASADSCSHLRRSRRRFLLSYVLLGLGSAALGALTAVLCMVL